MQIKLDAITLQLDGDLPALAANWRQIIGAWPALVTRGSETPDIILRLSLQEELPTLPPQAPDFVDVAGELPDDVGALAVYAGDPSCVTLHFREGALVTVPLAGGPGPLVASGVVTPRLLAYGRFEDVTFTSIAPLLRRRGYYLMHAFAAALEGRAILMVGRSGSGKTTTGVNLLLKGWSFLANDVVLLKQQPDGVYALPTPGAVSLTPETTTLLPELSPYRAEMVPNPLTAKLNFALDRLPQFSRSDAVPVGGIFFPSVAGRPETTLQALPRSVALARLSEESVDRWDRPALDVHLALLAELCAGARCYSVEVGRDFEKQAAMLSRAIAD